MEQVSNVLIYASLKILMNILFHQLWLV